MENGGFPGVSRRWLFELLGASSVDELDRIGPVCTVAGSYARIMNLVERFIEPLLGRRTRGGSGRECYKFWRLNPDRVVPNFHAAGKIGSVFRKRLRRKNSIAFQCQTRY